MTDFRNRPARGTLVASGLTIVAIGLLVLRIEQMTSRLSNNLGYLELNRMLTTGTNEGAPTTESRFRSSIVADADSISARYGLALLQTAQGHDQEAIAEWKDISASEEILTEWAARSRRAGDLQAAIRWYDLALGVNPAGGDTWYWRGETFAQSGDWQEALHSYQRITDTPTMQLEEIGMSDVYCAIAWTNHWLSTPPQPQKADEFYILAENANAFGTSVAAARCHFKHAELLQWKLGELERALARYDSALQLDPPYLEAASAAAYLRYKLDGDGAGAEKALRDLIAEHPDDKWGYLRLADLLVERKELLRAQTTFHVALSLAPDDAQIQAKLQALEDALAHEK